MLLLLLLSHVCFHGPQRFTSRSERTRERLSFYRKSFVSSYVAWTQCVLIPPPCSTHTDVQAVPRSGAPSPALSPRNTFRLHTHPPHRSASIAGGLFHFSRELSSSIRGERLPGRRRSQQRRQLLKACGGRERARSFMLACDGHQV